MTLQHERDGDAVCLERSYVEMPCKRGQAGRGESTGSPGTGSLPTRVSRWTYVGGYNRLKSAPSCRRTKLEGEHGLFLMVST